MMDRATYVPILLSENLENGYQTPEERVKVFPITALGSIGQCFAEFAAKKIHAQNAEDEYEENEEAEENGNIVQCSEHYY